MQSNELRIGNYVTLIDDNEPDEVVILLTIDEIDGCYYNSMPFQGTLYNQIDNCWCFFKIIHPTPLTVDWLKNFGFKRRKVQHKHHWENKIVIIEFSDGEFMTYTGHDIRHTPLLKYVHELQNLHYALTHTELILNNNRNEDN